MKQITQEIKAKIFALYWMQDIVGHPTRKFYSTSSLTGYQRQKAWLNVKTLSSITDEDVKNMPSSYWNNREEMFYYWFGSYNIEDKIKLDKLLVNLNPADYDYLRSKGYALPAFGYSVEELVEAGIFKLKE